MSVYAAVFAPNGRHVFSGARDAEIRKWSLETGRQVSEPLRFRNSITSLHYGPDHRTLVAASLSNEIFIIDADEFRILGKKRLSASSRLADIDVSSDGVIAAVQRGGDLTLWSSDLQVSEAISESRASALEFDMVSFIPRTEKVIALASNGTMSTADTTTGEFIGKPISLPPVNGSVRAAALSEQTKSYAVASEGRLFSGSFDKDLREIPMEGSQVSAVTFVPKSTELLVGHFDGRLQRISSVSGDILEDTKPHNGAIRHLQYSAYDETLWSAGDDITILRHGLDSNSATLQFTDHTSPIRALAIDPTGQRFASTETNNITIIRHIADNETQWTRRGHAIDFLSFSPDGKLLAMVEDRVFIVLYNVEEREEKKRLKGSPTRITGLAYHPSGEMLITVDVLGGVRVWSIENGSMVAAGDAGRGKPNTLNVSESGNTILTGGMDPRGSLRVFQLRLGNRK